MAVLSVPRKAGDSDDERNQSKRVYARIPETWIQRLAMKIICSGETPKHVAFIMDGNRRYAKEHRLANVTEGHRLGERAMQLLMDRCFDMGVKNVTVYAFSLENFKRSKQELDGLFGLLDERLDDYEGKTKEERDTRYFGVRIIGDISRFPSYLREKLANFILNEGSHYKQWLNICLGYTSRAEITDAIKSIEWGVRKGFIHSEDVNQSLLESCFWSSCLPPVDLLVRTSGEVRLSDFLTWQTMFTHLVFTETLWPDMTCWSLLKIFITYQRHHEKMTRVKDQYLKLREKEERQYLKDMAITLNQEVELCREERETRVLRFLQMLTKKRHEELREYVTVDISTSNSQLNKESFHEMMDIFAEVQTLSLTKSYEEVKEFFLDATEAEGLLKERMEKMIDYNMKGFCSLVPYLVAYFMKRLQVKATEKEFHEAEIMGWLVGLVLIAIQVSDDICDDSKTRCGEPSWHTIPKIGKTAVLDCNLIYSWIPLAVHHFFGQHPLYQQIALEMSKLILAENVGMFMDIEDYHKPGTGDIDVNRLKMGRFRGMASLKTNASHLGSIFLFVAGESNCAVHREAWKFANHFSFGCQAIDDYYDVFPTPGSSMGTDIKQGKLTWLICRALEKASLEQRKILEENYGKENKKSVRAVKKVFRDLELKREFQNLQLMPEEAKNQTIDVIIRETKHSKLWGEDGFPMSVIELMNKLFNAGKQNFTLFETGLRAF